MSNPYVGFRCPQDVYDALQNYLAETGQEQSKFLIGLVRKELGIKKDLNLIEKVEELDDRVSKIEAQLNAD